MYRLFVAIRPPPPVREQLLALMGGVAGARWQEDGQLHLTLRFIGEVNRHTASDIHSALAAIRHRPFSLALDGLGCFEHRGRPASIWAGVAPEAQVRTLQKKVEQALIGIGLEPERRAFAPHITIGRLGRSSGPPQALLETMGGITSAPFEVGGFGLFESRLTPDGSAYSPLELYSLG